MTRCSQVTWLRSLVVEDTHDPAAVGPPTPVFGDRDEFGHVVHLHGAVTNEADHGSIWMREFLLR
jgi:hypothetical protein